MDLRDRLGRIRTAFDESNVTRRDYLRATAGVGALTLPGQALAQTPGDTGVELTETYRFI